MICDNCQQNLPDGKFKIKYYRDDWTPYRRKTCKNCKWDNNPDKVLKRKLARSKRYGRHKKTKKEILYTLDENKEKMKLIIHSAGMIFLKRCYNRLNKARTKYWADKITYKQIRPEYIYERFEIQNHQCIYCKTPLLIDDPKTYEVDHIISFSCWGRHEESNIQFLCPQCHHTKSWYEASI